MEDQKKRLFMKRRGILKGVAPNWGETTANKKKKLQSDWYMPHNPRPKSLPSAWKGKKNSDVAAGIPHRRMRETEEDHKKWVSICILCLQVTLGGGGRNLEDPAHMPLLSS